MKKTILIPVLTFLILLTALILHGNRIPSYVSREEPALGTFVAIKIEKTQGYEALLDKAFENIRQLEKVFSAHTPDSELARLNNLKKAEVSFHLLELIKKSTVVSEITGGAFDITVLPLIELYKQAELSGNPPVEKEIRECLARTGWHKIEIKGTTVKIPCGLDMGGIAKGYIVDKTAEFLKEHGVKNGLVNAGGDIYCFGRPPRGEKWRIGIQSPSRKDVLITDLYVSGFAVATSGDYERYLLIKGKKFGHIIDPVTGKTVQNSPAGITVTAVDASTADALATAFYVMGVEKSIKTADRLNGVEVFIIDGAGKTHQSRNFSNFALP